MPPVSPVTHASDKNVCVTVAVSRAFARSARYAFSHPTSDRVAVFYAQPSRPVAQGRKRRSCYKNKWNLIGLRKYHKKTSTPFDCFAFFVPAKRTEYYVVFRYAIRLTTTVSNFRLGYRLIRLCTHRTNTLIPGLSSTIKRPEVFSILFCSYDELI